MDLREAPASKARRSDLHPSESNFLNLSAGSGRCHCISKRNAHTYSTFSTFRFACFSLICLQEMYKKLSDHDHQVEAAVGLAIATMIVVVTMFEDDGKDDAGSGTD